MSVLDKYTPITRTMLERRRVPIPASSGLGQLPSLELFEALPETLGLVPVGVYTAWATRTGDLHWREEAEPDTNLMVWRLTDRDINRAQEQAFGNPLPFVAIMTVEPMSNTAIEAMWHGTAFEPYETLAVFRQDDAQSVPTIRFLHWGQRIDMADAPQHLKPLESAAAQYNAELVLAAQIGADGSTQREWPAIPFSDALTAQIALTPASAMPGAPPGPPPQIQEQTVVQAAAPPPFWQSRAGTVLVGVGAAAAVYWLVNRRREAS